MYIGVQIVKKVLYKDESVHKASARYFHKLKMNCSHTAKNTPMFTQDLTTLSVGEK